mgnify:CR=1 FL=1
MSKLLSFIILVLFLPVALGVAVVENKSYSSENSVTISLEELSNDNNQFIYDQVATNESSQSDTIRGRWIWAKVTAYTAGPESCGPYTDGYTSTMVNTRSNNPHHVYGIAVNPRVIRYGSSIYVPGYWESLQQNRNLRPIYMTVADDTGSAMRNFRPHWRNVNGERVFVETHIDIRYRSVKTCHDWGVKYMRIFIYE